jgi:hypothetical protein
MRYLEINSQRWVAVDHIAEVYVSGREHHSQIMIRIACDSLRDEGGNDNAITYQLLSSREGEPQTALAKAENELKILISNLADGQEHHEGPHQIWGS